MSHGHIPGETCAHPPANLSLTGVLFSVVLFHLQQFVLVSILNKHVAKLGWVSQIVSWVKKNQICITDIFFTKTFIIVRQVWDYLDYYQIEISYLDLL